MACLSCARRGLTAIQDCPHDVRVPPHLTINEKVAHAAIEVERDLELSRFQANARADRRPKPKRPKAYDQWPTRDDVDRTRRIGAKGVPIMYSEDRP